MHKTGALAKAVIFRIQFGDALVCESYDWTVTELVQVWGGVVAWDIICRVPGSSQRRCRGRHCHRGGCFAAIWRCSGSPVNAAQAATQTAASAGQWWLSQLSHPPVDSCSQLMRKNSCCMSFRPVALRLTCGGQGEGETCQDSSVFLKTPESFKFCPLIQVMFVQRMIQSYLSTGSFWNCFTKGKESYKETHLFQLEYERDYKLSLHLWPSPSYLEISYWMTDSVQRLVLSIHRLFVVHFGYGHSRLALCDPHGTIPLYTTQFPEP